LPTWRRAIFTTGGLHSRRALGLSRRAPVDVIWMYGDQHQRGLLSQNPLYKPSSIRSKAFIRRENEIIPA
jgi:hypothetical protein